MLNLFNILAGTLKGEINFFIGNFLKVLCFLSAFIVKTEDFVRRYLRSFIHNCLFPIIENWVQENPGAGDETLWTGDEKSLRRPLIVGKLLVIVIFVLEKLAFLMLSIKIWSMLSRQASSTCFLRVLDEKMQYKDY